MKDEDFVREKVTEAFRLLAEALTYLSPPEIPKLTLWVNREVSDHTPTPAYDSELKKMRRRPPYPRRSGKSFTRPGQRQGIGKK